MDQLGSLISKPPVRPGNFLLIQYHKLPQLSKDTGWMGYGEERKDIDWDDSPLRRKVNPTMSLSMGKIIIFIGKTYKSRVCIWRPQPPVSSINPQRGNLYPGTEGHMVCFWVEKSHPLCYFSFLRGKWWINRKLTSSQSEIQANLASMENRAFSPILWEIQPLQPKSMKDLPWPPPACR